MEIKSKENPKKKLKILCLHGFGTNSEILEYQLKSWKKQFIDEIDFIPVNGKPGIMKGFPHGHDYRLDKISDKETNSNMAYVKEDAFKEHQFNREIDAERTDSVKLKNTSIYVKAIEKLGGVDGILGFSQGTRIVQHIFTELQLGTSKIKKEHRPKFAIFIGALINNNNIIINYPSLHLIGEVDTVTTQCLTMSYIFNKPSIVYFQGGHHIPKLNSLMTKVLKFFFKPWLEIHETSKTIEEKMERGDKIIEERNWKEIVILKSKDIFAEYHHKL